MCWSTLFFIAFLEMLFASFVWFDPGEKILKAGVGCAVLTFVFWEKTWKLFINLLGLLNLSVKKKRFGWKVIQVFWIVKLGRISCLNVSKSCSLYRVYKSLRHLNLFSASPSSTAHFYHTFIPKCGDRTEEELTLNLQNWWVDVQCVPVQQTNTMFCCVCWSLIWL